MRCTRAEGRPAARSLTTQFVVVAAGESDGELLDYVRLDGRRAPEQLELWSWLLRLCEEGK